MPLSCVRVLLHITLIAHRAVGLLQEEPISHPASTYACLSGVHAHVHRRPSPDPTIAFLRSASAVPASLRSCSWLVHVLCAGDAWRYAGQRAFAPGGDACEREAGRRSQDVASHRRLLLSHARAAQRADLADGLFFFDGTCDPGGLAARDGSTRC
jgi:hypothetical protein